MTRPEGTNGRRPGDGHTIHLHTERLCGGLPLCSQNRRTAGLRFHGEPEPGRASADGRTVSYSLSICNLSETSSGDITSLFASKSTRIRSLQKINVYYLGYHTAKDGGSRQNHRSPADGRRVPACQGWARRRPADDRPARPAAPHRSTKRRH